MTYTELKTWALQQVTNNCRIRQRLLRLTKLAKDLGYIK